ncbi:DUF4330 domain-containing protein [Oscillatoria salina]|uniref:DUF4330 domain-containing protein n=1 Tax=Oscillatoria salina TaxID=331517 RepID=UPI001CCC69D6|nr:DUF4330 domain-containing protein [Oscillatoria salina]MBZ8181412.1 DUF4330 domain-containing protein [Oscillatoria salina IIICB1]
MKLLDSQGRLFGKVSLLDLGAAAVIFLVIIGIFVFPGTPVTSVAQVTSTKPIEVDVIVRGLSVRNPKQLISQFQEEKKTKIIIRNQRYGEVDVLAVQPLQKQVIVPQPDGSVKALPDPRTSEDSYSTNMLMTLGGQAQITPDGAVLGNNKVKIGTTIELEGSTYNFNSSVIDVRY